MLKDKKLLYLIKTMDLGGAEKFTLSLANYFKDYFKSVTIASSGGMYEEVLKQNNIAHYKLKTELNISNLIPLSKELNSFVKLENFDIVHTHHRLLQFALQIIRGKNFKNLYTSHNLFNDLYQKMIFPDAAVAVSPIILNNLITTSLISRKRIFLINYGIEIPVEYPFIQYPYPLRFGFTGRFIEEKGIYILLKAITRLKSDGYKFSFLFRGKGENDKINNMIMDNKLEDVIKVFPPSINTDEIYPDFDILVIPTKLNEGLPISILEAASKGKLVIAGKAGGVIDFIENYVTGILLEDINDTEVYEKMKSVIMGNVNTDEIVNKAFHKVQEQFSINTACMKYQDLYKNILS